MKLKDGTNFLHLGNTVKYSYIEALSFPESEEPTYTDRNKCVATTITFTTVTEVLITALLIVKHASLVRRQNHVSSLYRVVQS